MSKKRVVVSLGHDALGYTTTEQWDAVKVTAKALADLVEADYQLTITHSNGPQVSMIHKAMTELRRVYIDYTPAPMCVCSAMSQGYVGYDIQNSLRCASAPSASPFFFISSFTSEEKMIMGMSLVASSDFTNFVSLCPSISGISISVMMQRTC